MVASNEELASNEPVSMLIRFSGSNIRSFRDDFEISMQASAIAEKDVVRRVPWRDGDKASSRIDLLPAAAIFGANASGKSNVLKALADMRSVVVNSFRNPSISGRSLRRPFLLNTAGSATPTRFEVELILHGVLHRYGFTVDDENVLSEWAERFPRGRSQKIFTRDRNRFTFGSSVHSTTEKAAELVRPNALFLSTVVALRGDELRPLHDWFLRNLLLANAGNRDGRQFFTARQLGNPNRRAKLLALLQAADLGIVDVVEASVELSEDLRTKIEQVLEILHEGEDEIHLPDLPNPINLMHRGEPGRVVRMDMDEESLGTVVWLGLVGPVIDALEHGSVLLADELDASLHPALVEQVVRLFQSAQSNPRRAQLIFNSHDIHLLGDSQSARILGRDQVWFTEKDADGSTRIFGLTDLNPRREEAISKRYLSGRYGGVPILTEGDFQHATGSAAG